jgi:tetratricopeptide (TPR) repeat protein
MQMRVARRYQILVAVIAAAFLTLSHATGVGAAGDTSVEEKLDDALHHFRLAEWYAPKSHKMEHYQAAEELALEVLRIDPEVADAHFIFFAAKGRRLQAGNPLTSMWQLDSLNDHLARALALDPTHADALAAKGGMLLDLPAFLGGDRRAARRYLEQALQVNPTGPGTRLQLARLLMKEGQDERAREQLVLAAHYACRIRRGSTLTEAEHLLAQLDSERL